MSKQHNDFWHPFRCFLALIFLAATLTHGSARGAVRLDPYQASASLADRSEAGQTAAFQTAMRTVLVRVTGRRAADSDPVLAPLIGAARRYVQQYHPLPNNQLAVVFDGPAIERWLAQNGQPVWGRERPTTFVLLAVQSAPAAGTIVSREDTSELKKLIDDEAAARGIPLLWPSAQDLKNEHLDYGTIVGMPAAALAEAARRLGGDGVLVGRAGNASAAAGVRWTHVYQDHSSEFSGPTEGVDRAADDYASLFAVTGSSAPVDIEVDGIDDVKDYASVQTYLESLAFVTHVNVQALGSDTVRFRLTMRGGMDSLQRAVALGGRLVSRGPGDGGMQRFQMRR